MCLAMKPVGKPDAGNPHVRFDERGGETEPPKAATAPFLDSTRNSVSGRSRREIGGPWSCVLTRLCRGNVGFAVWRHVSGVRNHCESMGATAAVGVIRSTASASGSAGRCAQPGMRQGELGVMRAGRSDGDLDATDGDGDAGAEFEQLQADGAAGRLRQFGVRQTIRRKASSRT